MNNNNEDDYCFAPVCLDEEPTCYITSENNDNTRCYTADDSVGFCLNNECKTPEEAHTAVNGATWVTGSYSDCNCTVDATRTVECQLEGGTVVDNDLCMSSTKPASKAKCETLQQNLDCTYPGPLFVRLCVLYPFVLYPFPCVWLCVCAGSVVCRAHLWVGVHHKSSRCTPVIPIPFAPVFRSLTPLPLFPNQARKMRARRSQSLDKSLKKCMCTMRLPELVPCCSSVCVAAAVRARRNKDTLKACLLTTALARSCLVYC